MRITDINGQLVYEIPLPTGVQAFEKEIQLKVASGLYFVHIVNSRSSYTEKIFIR